MADGYSQVYHNSSGSNLDIRRGGTKVDIYAGGVLAVACTLGWGLYLVKDKKEGE